MDPATIATILAIVGGGLNVANQGKQMYDSYTSEPGKFQFQGGGGGTAHQQHSGNAMNEAFMQMLLSKAQPTPMLGQVFAANPAVRMWQQQTSPFMAQMLGM